MEMLVNHDELNESESRFQQLATVCDQAVLVLTGEKIAFANDAALGVLGAIRTDQIVGQPGTRIDFPREKNLLVQPLSASFADTHLRRLDGAEVTVNLAIVPCRLAGKEGVMAVARDVGGTQRLERRLQFLSRHDILTELPNRTDFRDRLKGAMARAQRNARQVAVMLINLDGFKAVNTRYGSRVADSMLQEVARRLTHCVREADAVGRVSGDEFGLILEAIDQREQATVVANRVLQSIRSPFTIEGEQIEITASAGIAASPSDTRDLDALLRMADVAMYAAKEAGRGMFRLYFPEFEERSRRDLLRREQTAKRLATLTEREREVMDVLVEGNSNKAIGHMLGASPRTIENHRAKVMAKLEADSLPDLVRMVIDLSRAG